MSHHGSVCTMSEEKRALLEAAHEEHDDAVRAYLSPKTVTHKVNDGLDRTMKLWNAVYDDRTYRS